MKDLAELERTHIQGYLGDLAARWAPATVQMRFRALQQLFLWLVEEEEMARTPMERMRRPIVPEQPVDVVTPEPARRLLAECDGRDFVPRRDGAIVRLFIDTGMRLAEMAGLQLDDLDLELNVAIVFGKGRRPRSCPYGTRTTTALDRYLRARRRHAPGAAGVVAGREERRRADGQRGRAMLRRRGRSVGIPDLHPHQFRHTFAHEWLSTAPRNYSDVRHPTLSYGDAAWFPQRREPNAAIKPVPDHPDRRGAPRPRSQRPRL